MNYAEEVVDAGIKWLDAPPDDKRETWARLVGLLHNARADAQMTDIRVFFEKRAVTTEMCARIGDALHARFPNAAIVVEESSGYVMRSLEDMERKYNLYTYAGNGLYFDRETQAIHDTIAEARGTAEGEGER